MNHRKHQEHSPDRLALLQWTARMGAVTADALAIARATTVRSAQARLQACVRSGLLSSCRPLAQSPTLYVLSTAGLRGCALHGLDACRVSPANARHLATCAAVAAALERRYGSDHRVLGERELRRDEREAGHVLASAMLGAGPREEPILHRPDLVLWPVGSGRGRPVAVEVELTIKAPRRLADICRAWARCRAIAGTLYVAPPEVVRALERAIAKADAQDQVVAIDIQALSGPPTGPPNALAAVAGPRRTPTSGALKGPCDSPQSIVAVDL